MQNGIKNPASLHRRHKGGRSLPLRLFQGTYTGGTLALGKFHLGQMTRRREAQGMEHPVPSNSAKVPHQGFMLVCGDRTNYLIGPALNNSRINTCMKKRHKA